MCASCAVPTEVRERHQILRNWNCRTLSWEGSKTGRRRQSQSADYCEPAQGKAILLSLGSLLQDFLSQALALLVIRLTCQIQPVRKACGSSIQYSNNCKAFWSSRESRPTQLLPGVPTMAHGPLDLRRPKSWVLWHILVTPGGEGRDCKFEASLSHTVRCSL